MPQKNGLVNQDEIEQLLQESGQGEPAEQTQQRSAPDRPSPADSLDQKESQSPASKTSGTTGESDAPLASTAQSSQTGQSAEPSGGQQALAKGDSEKSPAQTGDSPPASSPSLAPEKPDASRTVGGAPACPTELPVGEGRVTHGDVEYLLNRAEQALQSIDSESGSQAPAGTTTFQFQEFVGAARSTEGATFELLSDVELDLKIELGRTHMQLEDVLKLRKGSVVPLDKLAGDPVDIYVNERLIARGEVLVLNDNFCVRVAELIVGSNPE